MKEKIKRKEREKKEYTYEKGYKHVNIPTNHNVELLKKIFDLEKSLYDEKGIYFDTGYACEEGIRDWELDWSLKGATPKEVISVLESRDIKFEAKKVPDTYETNSKNI